MDAVVLVTPILSGAPLVEASRRLGLEVLCVINLPARFFKPPMAVPPAERFDLLIMSDSEEEILLRLKPWRDRIRAVIAGAEAGVTLAERLAERLGLRHNDPALRSARRNKYDMKVAARAAGLRCARARKCRDEADLDAFVAEAGFPVVIKTPEGAATVQVYRCDDRETLSRRMDEILHTPNLFLAPAGYALTEEYLPGTEYAVNTFSDERGTFVTDVWRYHKLDGPQGDNLYYDAIQEPLDGVDVAGVTAYAVALTRAVGIRYGAAHAEIKATPDGPAMIEIAARLAGARMPALLERCTGFDVYKATLEAYLHGVAGQGGPPVNSSFGRIVLCPGFVPGRVRAIHGVDALPALPSYVAHDLSIAPGDTVGRTGALHDMPLVVWLVHPERAVLARDGEAVHRSFRVEVGEPSTRAREAHGDAR